MSRRRVRNAALVVVGATLLTALAAAPAAAARVHLTAELNGEQEAPGPGDPDGIGQAFVHIAPHRGRLCFEITVRRISVPATAAHIHVAPRGEPGPVVITLAAPDRTREARGCLAGLDPVLLRDIARNPQKYYVNVHTVDYPGGAVRGQLEPAPETG